jgi:hypothetical protein
MSFFILFNLKFSFLVDVTFAYMKCNVCCYSFLLLKNSYL